ncbi:MAG TPA: Stp1/IreP family PP2C-type Ser/Thr phosphatase [Acidobacteriaceae bacterium]|nr:Stp1/IreP family PP2C-type Ser/Thr phosphatase [Acidobacteriaceae bacterium]
METRTEQQAAIAAKRVAWAAAGSTDRGRVRHANEDFFVMRPEAGAFVVCDGMGGAAAGETASHLAAETAVAALIKAKRGAAAIREAIRLANTAVYERARQDRRLEGMGTTLVALSLSGDTAWVGHVGDSRCYRWRAGTLERLTQDHSLVEEQIRIGRMTHEQARRSPMQNVITRAVGTRAEVVADVQEFALQQGDLFLIASDGLMRELTDAAIGDILKAGENDLAAVCAALLAAANTAGGRDNITCVLVRVGS